MGQLMQLALLAEICGVVTWWRGSWLQVAHFLPHAGGSGRGIVRGARSTVHR
jgi:hypothetical protein